jgi:hypothetical protein
MRARAHALLLRLLDTNQRADYENTGGFWVVNETRRYRLDRCSLQVLVFERKARTPFENWCALLPNTPREDTLIAQLLLLRSDPEKLKRQCHVTHLDERLAWLGSPAGRRWLRDASLLELCCRQRELVDNYSDQAAVEFDLLERAIVGDG